MRYEKGHKESTRLHLLDIASKQFRKKGIEAVGIAVIMKEAGLTNGAFYAHFKSKKDLVDQVLIYVLEERENALKSALKQGLTLKDVIHEYLSPKHRDKCEQGCLFPSLLPEISRQEKSTRKILTEKIQSMQKIFSEHIKESNPALREQKATVIFSLMVGGLQLARAVTDAKLSDKILKDAIENALVMAGI